MVIWGFIRFFAICRYLTATNHEAPNKQIFFTLLKVKLLQKKNISLELIDTTKLFYFSKGLLWLEIWILSLNSFKQFE